MQNLYSGNIDDTVGFQRNEHIEFAGVHLLVDVKNAKNLDNEDFIEKSLRAAALDAKATILHSHMHKFSPQGVSGVIVLSESHISIHTWPEKNFAAIDIFMCGDCNPYAAIKRIKSAFETNDIHIIENKRGVSSIAE